MRCNKMVDDSVQVCPVCGSNKFRTAQAKKPVRPPRPQGGMQNNQQGMNNMNMGNGNMNMGMGMGGQQYNNGGYNQQYNNGGYNPNMGMGMNNGNMNMGGMSADTYNMNNMNMGGMSNYNQNMGMGMAGQQMNMNNGNMNMGNQQQTQNVQQQAPQKKEKKKKMSRKEKMQLEMEQMRQIQEARANGLPDPVFDNGQTQNANSQSKQRRGQVNNNMRGMQGNMQNMGNMNAMQQRFQDAPTNSGESSVKQWIITLVITAIPILNIIYCIMIMKNNNAEGYRRDFAKAFLIYLVIAFAVSLVIGNMLVSRLS